MSNQADITAKTTLTVTGTTSVTYKARGVTLNGGKPASQVATYRFQPDANVPAADTVFRVSSTERPVQGKYGPGWKADLRFEAPVMETLAAGDSAGYVAAPKAADFNGIWISTTMSDRATAADKAALLDHVIYMIANDAGVRAAILSRDVIA